ncbi:MAG: ATP-binding protein [Nitrospiraceae bacterium]
MREYLTRLFNNLPIERKLLLVSVIPLTALFLLSAVTYQSVQTVERDEEQLNRLYLTQNSAAQYMRLIVDLETSFRGYVLTLQSPYLRPFRTAQEGIFSVGEELARLVSDEVPHRSQFLEVQSLVKQLILEKVNLIEAAKNGHRERALQYMEEGRGRTVMFRIRGLMVTFDQLEQQRVVTRLGQLSQDRTATLMVILVGGILTLGLVASTLYLIARSIAGPLVGLAKAVGSSPTGSFSNIPLLERKDEIGYLTRVMHRLGVQIQSHLEQVERSEAALRVLNDNLSASESKYRGLVNNAPFGIFTTKGAEVTFSNRYNQTLAGLDPDDITDPDTFRQWIHPEDRDRVLSEFAHAVANVQPYETVFRFLHVNGSVRKVLSRRIPIEHGNTPQPIYIGFNIDITALDQMQTRLSRSERLATLGQVAAGIAHEIRNPLVGIGSNAFLLLDEFDKSDPRHADLEMILKETKRLDRIVNQIIDYARPRELAPVLYPLNDLIDDVFKLLDSTVTTKRLTLTRSISPTLTRLHADQDQIKQVLLNVIQNAIDASHEGTAIDVTAFELPRGQTAGMVVKVTDHGIGIPDNALTHVFEPFFTSGKRQGTGLGLAICRNIIESHGGDIQVTSKIGKGTSFRIWLPLRQEFQFIEG